MALITLTDGLLLLCAALLTAWGAHTLYCGQLSLRVSVLAALDERSARLAGLMALLEAAAIISYVQGHTTAALLTMCLTLPLLWGIVTQTLLAPQPVR